MGLSQTKNLMDGLGFKGMLLQFDRTLDLAQKEQWTHVDFINMLIQMEHDFRMSKKIENRIKFASFKEKQEFEKLDYTTKRTINKTMMKDLYSLNWMGGGRVILLIGKTGIGKSFIAQALGLHACRNNHSVLFLTCTEFLEGLLTARASSTYIKFRDKLARLDLFILDDFGSRKLNSMEAQDLCEILEERSYTKATIITSQLTTEHWKEVIPDPVIADAIIDRVIHTANLIKIEGDSYRKEKAKKLEKGKDLH
jgi:DNA replication protein DnaC